jgi:transposase-like protein
MKEKITRGNNGISKAMINEINADMNAPVVVRQAEYLNNSVEQDHGSIKRVTKPTLNFQFFSFNYHHLGEH